MRRVVFILLLLATSCVGFCQTKAVTKIAERISAKGAKEAAFKTASKRTAEDLLREGIERTGKKYTGEALGEQIAKRVVRENVMKRMEKEGMESFLDYGKSKALKEFERMGASNVKRNIILKDAATATRPSAYHLAIEKNSTTEYRLFGNVGKRVESKYLETRIAKSLLYKQLLEMQAKGAIKLSEKELAYLLANPKQLRNFIKLFTGDNKKFQEFFIRLAMNGNSEQVKLLLGNSEIKKYIKKAIRRNGEGGVHEWLLTSNFEDFLTNPKWSKDGPFLALALTKLVQKTENVIFKTGGGHVSASRVNSAASVAFHNGLAEAISKCSTKEEVFMAVKRYATNNLDPKAYKEFVQIYADVLRKA